MMFQILLWALAYGPTHTQISNVPHIDNKQFLNVHPCLRCPFIRYLRKNVCRKNLILTTPNKFPIYAAGYDIFLYISKAVVVAQTWYHHILQDSNVSEEAFTRC